MHYKEKVTYEEIFSVRIIQKAYKSYRVSFFGESKKCTKIAVSKLGVELLYEIENTVCTI